MKNIQNWEKFNESYNQEVINEGLLGDIIKLPFKIVGFLLKPLVPLLLKVIGKTISIENKWKVIKAILDNVVKLAFDIDEAKKKLAKEGTDLTPNERRDLEKKVEKFKKQYPNGFKFSEVKKKLVESVEKNFAKATDDKKKEDLEWILKKISEYKISKPYFQSSAKYNLEQLDDLIVESIEESDEDLTSSKRTAISNFPHIAKEESEARERRIKKSQKEDPDGMYPRDNEDKSRDNGGWQDGMGKPSWLGEGRTDKGLKSKDSDVKKDAFRDKIESHFKSLKYKYKRVGDDFEAECEATKDGDSIQVMFRPDYIGLKKKGDKHTQEFNYNELGKIKSEISKLLK